MLAEDGRCKTLDMSADGYVRAEAAAGVILVLSSSVVGTPLQGCAVLAATAVNQDGR
jgi:acyl transferase domain-containing protein